MSETTPASLSLFSLQDGHVESDAPQELVDAFAADFQGLRHFGSKIGESLNLGPAWAGILQEEDLSVGYAYHGEGTGPKDPGAGALVDRKANLYELITQMTAVQED